MELKLSQVEERINKYSYDQSPISKAFLQDNLNRLKEQNEYLNDLGGLEASSKEEAREKMEGKGLKASMFVDKAQYDAAISEAEYAVQKLEVQEARAYRSSGEGVQVAMNALQKNWFERNGLYGSSYLTNTYGDLLNEARGATESHMGSDLQSYTSLAGWRSSVDGYELMQEKFEFSKPELQSVSAAPKQIELPRVDAGEIPVPQKTIEIPRSFIAHLDTAGEGAVKSYSKNVADYVSKSELDKKVGKDEVVAIKIHVPYERANKVNQDFNEKLESTLVSSIKAELESRGIKNAVVEAGENPTMSFSKLAQRVDENNWQGIQKQFKAKGGVMAVNDDGKAKSISSDLKKGGFDYSQITKAPTLGAFQSALQEASTYHQEPIYLQKASNASVQSVYDPDRQVAVSVQKRGNEGRKK